MTHSNHNCAKKNLYYVFTGAFLITALYACNNKKDVANKCKKENMLGLSIKNDSYIDTIAFASVNINKQNIYRSHVKMNTSSLETFDKKLKICDGPASIHVTFGRFTKDTTLNIIDDVGISISMSYDDKFDLNNGIVIYTYDKNIETYK